MVAKTGKILLGIILIITLLINNVFPSCSLATQANANYETNILEIKGALTIYRDDITKQLYEPISDQYTDTFSVYVAQLQDIVRRKTEEQSGVLILPNETRDILATMEILEQITGKIGTDDSITQQGTRTAEIIGQFPVGSETRTAITSIQEKREAIESYTQQTPSVDENTPYYNDYIEKIEGKTNGIDILDGALGIITYPFKLVILLVGLLAQSIMSLIASTGTPNGGIWLTIDNILFNQLALTDINIFSDSIFLIGAGGNYQQETLTSTNTLLSIRQSIAEWYYAFRNLAIVAALLMLIYIGIRMAISNIAEQKAKYKAMLTNWFVGFGLIFVLHFIIIMVIKVNNAIIEILAKTNLTDNQEAYSNIMNQLFTQSWSPQFTLGWASAIMWAILVVMTFIMLIMFIKRFITVSFLALISPLITVTYAMDKAGDNKSQILNTWLKEFCYNVFIQIVYALSYLIFAKVGIDLMVEKLDFGALILAVLSMLAMFLGVKIIKQIFGFDKAGNLVKQLGMAVVINKTISTGKKAVNMGKDRIQAHKNNNPATTNLPMHTPSGQDTDAFVAELTKEKKKKAMDERIAEKSKQNQEKTSRPKRSLKNASNAIRTPVRAYTRMAKGVLAKGLGIDKLQEAIQERRVEKVTLNAQDILEGVLKDYVKKKKPNMTKKEFEERINYVEKAQLTKKANQYNQPLEDAADWALRSFIDAAKQTQGTAQVQRIIANFKDTNFKDTNS